MNFLKTTSIAAALTALATFATPGHAFMNWSGAVGDLPTQNAAFYYLETAGSDVRVYEWKRPETESVICVAMFSNGSGPVGHTCVNVGRVVNISESPRRRDSTGYRVEARGSDLRVYNWSLFNAGDVACTAVFANAGNAGLQCTHQVE